MPSRFQLQIIERSTGAVVQLEPGLSAEKDFVHDITQRIINGIMKATTVVPKPHSPAFVTSCVRDVVKRGVGLFCTTAHVTQDIEDGVREALVELSDSIVVESTDEVRARLESLIETGIAASFHDLKVAITDAR